MKTLSWLVFLCLLWVARAEAQEQERPITWQINGGYSATTGTTADYLDGGWIIGGGVTWHPRPDLPWSLRAEIHYSEYNATRKAIDIAQSQTPDVRIDDGDASLFGMNFNGVYSIPLNGRVRGYLTAGIGFDHRKVQLTQTVLVSGYYCDPWWGYCYPGVGAGEAIVADESTTKFAWNAGGGLEFATGYGGLFFIEARYHRTATGTATEIVPIQVGLRF